MGIKCGLVLGGAGGTDCWLSFIFFPLLLFAATEPRLDAGSQKAREENRRSKEAISSNRRFQRLPPSQVT